MFSELKGVDAKGVLKVFATYEAAMNPDVTVAAATTVLAEALMLKVLVPVLSPIVTSQYWYAFIVNESLNP